MDGFVIRDTYDIWMSIHSFDRYFSTIGNLGQAIWLLLSSCLWKRRCDIREEPQINKFKKAIVQLRGK